MEYIFISYARPDASIAEQVENALTVAGFRVFRDKTEIRCGDQWDMTIETALCETSRMVLVLSPASMPFRHEVYREWFYFDQKHKPIHPLYVQDCTLHSRLLGCNYLDARHNLNTALNQLIEDIQHQVNPPLPKTGMSYLDLKRRWEVWQAGEREKLFHENLHTQVLNVPSPLHYLWNEFSTRSWHEEISDMLKHMRETAAQFPQLNGVADRIDRIDIDAGYKILLGQLRWLLDERNGQHFIQQEITRLEKATRTTYAQVHYYEQTFDLTPDQSKLLALGSFRQHLHDLRAIVEKPHFRRCFLVTGGMGSGKTHFITSLMRDYPSGLPLDLDLFLPLTPGTIHLEQTLLHNINEAAQGTWHTLRDFDDYLAGYQPGGRARLVVVLDDLSRFALRQENFIQELAQFIEAHTHLHHIYWLITMPITFYKSLTGREFWKEYAADYHPYYRSIRNDKDIPNIGGWLVLDDLNERYNTGRRIIQQVQPSQIAVDLLNDQQNQNTRRYLSNPFIALVWLQLRDQLESAVNLNFVGFIEHFWQRHIAHLQQTFPDVNSEELKQFVYLIAQFLYHGGSFFPSRQEILDQVKPRITEPEHVLCVLQQGFLIKPELNITPSPLLGGMKPEKIEIRFEPFWALLLAQTLVDAISQSHHLRADLEKQFSIPSTARIGESLLEFFLLLEENRFDMHQMINLYQIIQSSHVFPQHAVWLAGAKANPTIQTALFDSISQLHPEKIDGQTLFALMYFVGSLECPTPFEIFQPFYKRIAEEGLTEYFLYLTRQYFQQVDDPEIIAQTLVYFSGCEVMDVTDTLAGLTAEALYEIMRDDIETLPELLLKYLHDVEDEYPDTRMIPGQEHGWHRYLFREWLLHFTLSQFAAHFNDDIYEGYRLLTRIYWYDRRDLRHNHSISIQMEREANLAFGLLWRRYHNENIFLNFINELANSKRQLDRRNAFFIIRHTVPQPFDHQEHDTQVDARFRSILENLFTDTALEYTLKNTQFYNFMRANLVNFSQLEQHRKLQRER